MKHAKAVSQLAEIRGSNTYKDQFNNTLLKAARGLIVGGRSFCPDYDVIDMNAGNALCLLWGTMLPSLGTLACGDAAAHQLILL